MVITTSQSTKQHYAASRNGPDSTAPDGCRDAVSIESSLSRMGRLDWAQRDVVITTRMGGNLVLQRIGFNCYNGVAAELRAGATASDAPTVRLVLRHQDRANAILLDDALPLEEAVAVWRGWADRLSVPLLLLSENGEDSLVRDMLGPVLVKKTQARRTRSLAGRRPRYAKRRAKR